MANIVVTSTSGFIKVVFNDLADEFGMVKGNFNRNQIAEIVEMSEGGVMIVMAYPNGLATSYKLSYDGNNGAQIDSVDGTTPSSNSNLCDLIGALITA